MKTQRRILPFECKSVGEGEEHTFSGLAGCHLSLDWAADIFAPGAFEQDLEYTRTEGKIRDEHEVTTGRITEAKSTAAGLEITGLILPTAAGRDQYILVKGKAITKLSVGYEALKATWLESGDAILAYWNEKSYRPSEEEILLAGRMNCARLIERARCYEVSTTWMPCNDNTQITDVKGKPRVAGKTFAAHSETALGSVEELIERAKALKALRTEAGRELGTKTRATVGRLQSQLAELLQATEPEEVADHADADMALYHQYLSLGGASR